MAEALTIARPYAEAAFRLAKAGDTLSAWSSMLQFTAVIAVDKHIRTLLGNPEVSTKRLGELLLDICGDKLNNEGRNFILLLVENKRVEVLPEIRDLFEQLKAQHEGVLEAKIASAFAMTDVQLKDLVAGLESKFKRKIEAKVNVSPELIG
ncbi:MAG: F0F1 ATP synthase subunit delta, partial [Nitrosomonadales bacterium]